ncbi:amidase family protein [Bisporella sp. PMI_857]|nr:amidase family protein [Bisporella sp. PMI_857]
MEVAGRFVQADKREAGAEREKQKCWSKRNTGAFTPPTRRGHDNFYRPNRHLLVPRTLLTALLRGYIPSFPDHAHHKPLFNTLTATASNLQKELASGKIKSTQIVEEYHRSIVTYNGVLNAVWELAPGAMKRAEELDLLRAKGQFLGPFHGIPILIKDNINLDPSFGLGTTGGALALVDLVPSSSATIIEKVRFPGSRCLIRSTNLGSGIRCGWSAAAGQSQSAYVRGGLDMQDSIVGHSSPDGSSSESGVAVSAGFAPIALGTETLGSLVNPATRAALFTVKPTLGIVPSHGIMPISTDFDTAGPMTKSPKDAADLLTLLVDPEKTKVPEGGYAVMLGGDWKDIKNSEVRAVFHKIETLAKTYHGSISNVAEENVFELEDDSDALLSILTFDIQKDMDAFLQGFDSIRVHSLKELVDWNFEHSELALTAGTRDDFRHIKAIRANFIDLFSKYDVDVIIAPTDSPLFRFSGAGGFPTATLPISCIDFNGRPFGLTIAALPHNEAMLFKVIGAWETTFPPIKTPEAYLSLQPLD